MQGKFDVYVNKKMKPFFDLLEAQADIEGKPFNHKLGDAVEYYIKETNGVQDLISKSADHIIKSASKEELVEYNRLINEINNKILKRLF